jgi:broad specificity phosphatase PhoE
MCHELQDYSASQNQVAAGITAIYVTSLKRTQTTAAPLAKALGLTPVVLVPGETAALIRHLREHRGAALVVGHGNTVPEIVKLLGVKEPVAVADSEFEPLFVVTTRAASPATLVRLHYR